jgi:hypothetical protein
MAEGWDQVESGHPTNQTRHRTDLERLQRLLVVLGNHSGSASRNMDLFCLRATGLVFRFLL